MPALLVSTLLLSRMKHIVREDSDPTIYDTSLARSGMESSKTEGRAMKRWVIVGVAVAFAVVLSLTIIIFAKTNTATANCQPPVSVGVPVATPNDAQKQYVSTHNCGVTPRPWHSSTMAVPEPSK